MSLTKVQGHYKAQREAVKTREGFWALQMPGVKDVSRSHCVSFTVTWHLSFSWISLGSDVTEKTSREPWLVWLSGLSVGWEPKGRRFDSQSGHMPGLWARSSVGGM